MDKLSFTATPKQWQALEGLAYWRAEAAYIAEREGTDGHDYSRAHDTLTRCQYPECDRLAIPYWVQNTVAAYGEDWRQYTGAYMARYLAGKGIHKEGATA